MISRFRPLLRQNWLRPETKPSQRRSRNTFKVGWNETLELLDREIEKLGAKEFVIEADFSESDIRLDGVPRANAKQPTFPGIRIAFDSRHGPLIYQTDSCVFWQHNVRSIALGLTALRDVDRYAITSRAEQYTGFLAIGSGTPMGTGMVPTPKQELFPTVREATAFLSSEKVAGFAGANALSPRRLWQHVARNAHPDVGGNPEEWLDILEAKRVLEKAGVL